jgi:hypothetical protein
LRVGRLSALMPKICADSPSNLAKPAWYADSSFVQPPVKAAGKNANTTGFFPLKPDNVAVPPEVDGSEKSGAASPTLRWVLTGV